MEPKSFRKSRGIGRVFFFSYVRACVRVCVCGCTYMDVYVIACVCVWDASLVDLISKTDSLFEGRTAYDCHQHCSGSLSSNSRTHPSHMRQHHDNDNDRHHHLSSSSPSPPSSSYHQESAKGCSCVRSRSEPPHAFVFTHASSLYQNLPHAPRGGLMSLTPTPPYPPTMP
jgi:hypothetical protein